MRTHFIANHIRADRNGCGEWSASGIAKKCVWAGKGDASGTGYGTSRLEASERKPISSTFVARLCAASIFTVCVALPQSVGTPLSRTDILGLLTSSTTPRYVAHVVQQRGLSFQPSDEFIQMVRRASVGVGVDGLEQLLKAPGSTRLVQAAPKSEAALLSHVVRCGELQHARPAAGAGSSPSAPLQAEAECRAAVELSPRNVFLLMALGSALEKSKPEAAIEVFRQAIALKPDLSEPHLLLADALIREADDRNAALGEALDALRLDPNNPDAFLFFQFLFGDAGLRDSELSLLLDETAKHPNDAATHWVLGLAYLNGKHDQGNAMPNIRQAVRLDPNNAWYHFYLSGLLRASGDIAGANAEAETARKLDPNNRTFQGR